MTPANSHHKPGLVGIISGELSRYPKCSQSLLRLIVPQGSGFRWVEGNGFALNRNLIVQQMQPHHEWLWFVDDDNSFEPDILMRLLDRNVDLIQPLIQTKKPPFQPYVYRYEDETGRFLTPAWDEIPTSGISEWDATATGGLLIRRHVLDAVGYPWFEEGKTSPDGLGEDLYFSRKAKSHGFRCYVDSDNRMWHWTVAGYRPEVGRDGKWTTVMDLGRNVKLGCDPEIGKENQLIPVGAPPR